GVATAVPLLLFAAAASRVPLSTVGLLQFLTPVLQLLIGVVVMGEHVPGSRWIGFALVWLALVILTVDMLGAAGRSRRDGRRAAAAAAAEEAAQAETAAQTPAEDAPRDPDELDESLGQQPRCP